MTRDSSALCHAVVVGDRIPAQLEVPDLLAQLRLGDNFSLTPKRRFGALVVQELYEK